MFAFLVSLLILDAILLSVVVLLQAGQGGGLASLGGATTDTVLGGRQAVTILTKLTWWCGGTFMLLSLLLSFVPRGAGSSGLQERLRQATPAAPSQQAPLPLGNPAPPSTETPKGAPAAGAPAQKAPLPLGAPAQTAPNQPQGAVPAPVTKAPASPTPKK